MRQDIASRGCYVPWCLERTWTKIKVLIAYSGVDFDDAGYGFKEEDKHAEKVR